MSDASGGPGWWLASDGKWYPPSQSKSVSSCPNGHEVPTGAGFCPECGAPIVLPTCPNGHPTVPGDAFCSVCGMPTPQVSAQGVAAGQPASSTMQSPAAHAVPSGTDGLPTAGPPLHKSRRKQFVVGGAAAVVAVIAVVAVVALTGSSSAYPQSIQTKFLAMAAHTGVTKKGATCILNWLESHVPISQFEKATAAEGDNWGEEAALSCVATITTGSKLNGAGFGALLTGKSSSTSLLTTKTPTTSGAKNTTTDGFNTTSSKTPISTSTTTTTSNTTTSTTPLSSGTTTTRPSKSGTSTTTTGG